MTLLRFDCGAIEPTPAACSTLGERLARELPSVDAAARTLSQPGGRILPAFDDTRASGFSMRGCGGLHTGPSAAARCSSAGKRRPTVGRWPRVGAAVVHLESRPLDDDAADALLGGMFRVRPGNASEASPRATARTAPRRRRERRRSEISSRLDGAGSVVAALAARFLDDVDDAETRRALTAAAVLRRATYLGACRHARPRQRRDRSDLARLQALPFVTLAHDGLVIHEAVRSALARSLAAVDPQRYRDLGVSPGTACGVRSNPSAASSSGAIPPTSLSRGAALDSRSLLPHRHPPAARGAGPARGREAIASITLQHDGAERAGGRGMVAGATERVLSRAGRARWSLFDPGFRRAGERSPRAGGSRGRRLAPMQPPRTCLGPAGTLLPAADHARRRRTPLDRTRGLFPRHQAHLSRDFAAARIYAAVHLNDEPRRLPVSRLPGARGSGGGAGRPASPTVMLDFGPNGIPGWIARLVDALYGAPAPLGLMSPRERVLDGQRA